MYLFCWVDVFVWVVVDGTITCSCCCFSVMILDCAAGKYSSEGATLCTNCASGKYSTATGTSANAESVCQGVYFCQS